MTAASAIPIPSQVTARAATRADLRIVDPTTEAGWDALLSTHPRATFFHSAAWAQTLADAYGFPSRYIAASNGGELRGLLPVIEARSWLRGTRGVSLPFTDECPPLVSPKVNAQSLLEMAMQEGTSRGWKYLELRGGHEFFENVPASTSYYGHRLSLSSRTDDVLDKCGSSVRGAIRKAERSGVTVRFGTDLESVGAYYRLHCHTRTKHGAPPQPFKFFQSLCDRALQTGHGFVALAVHDEQPIAGAVFLRFGRKAIYKFSASDERYKELCGPSAVIWGAVRKLIEVGVDELNFGNTSLSNEGLRKFKQRWGAEEYFVHHARYCFERGSFVKMGDLAAGAQARIFALLPVFLSRWIGRAAYPHMN